MRGNMFLALVLRRLTARLCLRPQDVALVKDHVELLSKWMPIRFCNFQNDLAFLAISSDSNNGVRHGFEGLLRCNGLQVIDPYDLFLTVSTEPQYLDHLEWSHCRITCSNHGAFLRTNHVVHSKLFLHVFPYVGTWNPWGSPNLWWLQQSFQAASPVVTVVVHWIMNEFLGSQYLLWIGC